jgi:hypothetical protein
MADHFRKLNGGSSSLIHILQGAGITAASISLVQAGFQQALSKPEILATDGSSLKTILILVNQIDAFKLLALALLSGAISLLVFRTKAIPIWLGWLSAVLSMALVIGGFSFISTETALTYVLFISLPLLLFWVGALSVSMLRVGGESWARINVSGQADADSSP